MNFLNDLADSIQEEANQLEDPGVALRLSQAADKALLSSIESGTFEAFIAVMQRGQIHAGVSQDVANAGVAIVGNAFERKALSENEMQQRLDAARGWIASATQGMDAAERKDRLSQMLISCFELYPNRMDPMAQFLIEEGADPAALFAASKSGPYRELSGMRVGLMEEKSSAISRAIYCGAPASVMPLMIEKDPSAFFKNDEVARILFTSTPAMDEAIPVGALAYSVAIADMKAFKYLLSEAVQLPTNEREAVLGNAMLQIRELGISDTGPDEVLDSLVGLIAAGADRKVVSGFVEHGMLVGMNPVTRSTDERYPGKEVSHFSLPALIPMVHDTMAAIEAMRVLKQCGWDVNGPAHLSQPDQQRWGTTAIHYAAASGRLPLIEELISLGADVSKPDRAGLQAMKYAAACGHADAARFLSAKTQPAAVANIQESAAPSSTEVVNHLPAEVFDQPVSAAPAPATPSPAPAQAVTQPDPAPAAKESAFQRLKRMQASVETSPSVTPVAEKPKAVADSVANQPSSNDATASAARGGFRRLAR